jgi:hypothetical protein
MSTLSNQSKLSVSILVIGFLLGLFLSWSLISGDQQGRVNILQLVVIYIFLPIFSLLFSSVSLLLGKNWNFARLVSVIPLWSQDQQDNFLRLVQHPLSKWYFFYQSQLAALSFSLASLLVLLILLISTDVNFIWRSTLLDAEQLFPFLEWLASPWQFWPSAQPNLELLQVTQDSRLPGQNSHRGNFAEWWSFIFAAQLFYAFLLRFISIIICKLYLKILDKRPKTIHLTSSNQSKNDPQRGIELAPLVNNINSDFTLNNWCGLNKNLLQKIQNKLQYSKTSELSAGPLASHSEQMVAERWQDTQLLIVKGWEPPLAELADFMQNGKGYLLPLDWQADEMQALSEPHLNEWRRFVNHLANWQLLHLESL